MPSCPVDWNTRSLVRYLRPLWTRTILRCWAAGAIGKRLPFSRENVSIFLLVDPPGNDAPYVTEDTSLPLQPQDPDYGKRGSEDQQHDNTLDYKSPFA